MDKFKEDMLRTESTQFNELVDKDGKVYSTPRLVHSYTGMLTEVAEFADAIKKSLFYGKILDPINLKEEIGDLIWYMYIAMDELDTDMDTESRRVINKLKARYPSKFDSVNAEIRDLVSERRILEDKNV